VVRGGVHVTGVTENLAMWVEGPVRGFARTCVRPVKGSDDIGQNEPC